MRNKNKGHSPKKRMGLKKLLALMTLCTLMLSGGVLAIYVMWFQGTQETYVYTIDGDLTGSLDMASMELNTTLTEDEGKTGVEIINPNGNLTALFEFGVTTLNNDPVNCPDYLGDCLSFAFINSQNVFDQDNITLVSGSNWLNVTVECQAHSCPLNISHNFSLTEI